MATIADAARPFPQRPVPAKSELPDPRHAAALRAAAAAERAAHRDRCPPRRRVAFLICELGMRLGPAAGIALGRSAIADALELSLWRVKRVLGLFVLSGDLDFDGRRIRVRDWRRMCAAAGYDGTGLVADFDDEEPSETEKDPSLTTGSGEPAFFG